MDKIRWGILGTGRIAAKFALGLSALDDAELVAVGSRSAASAAAFADQFAIPHRHASYADLAADAAVDVVYVATPHTLHKQNSILCLEAGKAVLCEKPFTLNAAEASELIACARRQRRFLMEAMWSRFLPHMVRLRQLLAAEAIGELRLLKADFCFRTEVNPQSRLFDPALGGGGLLDVGVYPVSLAMELLGRPDQIASVGQLGETGVDEQAGIVFGYRGGQMAVLTSAIRTSTPHEATLFGSAGAIRLHHPWWAPTKLTLTRTGHEEQLLEVPAVGNGYNYEAAEVMACLRAGRSESALMPLDASLAVMEVLDRLRAQWGLQYPVEIG